jgi:hypothetical protein
LFPALDQVDRMNEIQPQVAAAEDLELVG